MPTLASWNLGRTSCLDLIIELIQSEEIDVLIFAEQAFESAALTREFHAWTGRDLYALPRGLTRVSFYSTSSPESFRPTDDDAHFSVVEFLPGSARSLLIAGVRLRSQLHDSNEHVQQNRVGEMLRQIQAREGLVGHERTVVIGDFNMDPFEAGMVISGGMHGVMDRRIAAKGSRNVGGREHTFFYNPMWKLMGDHTAEALGTYYAGPRGDQSCFWHTFDQALLRPSLLAYFRVEGVRIVQQIGTTSLLSRRRPGIDRRISDHLPVVVTLNT